MIAGGLDPAQFYWIDLIGQSCVPLPAPGPTARVAGYDAVSDCVLFIANDRSGTSLWISSRSCPATAPQFQTNLFLQTIAVGLTPLIDYQSLKEEPLQARLLLPPDYQPGKAYPTVVWVYPGRILSADAWGAEINEFLPLNLQILAAQGYVVLEPSMPLNPEGEADHPLLRLTEGVLPAIDRAMALGIADPDRLFLMGLSFGGYAVYGLITQTHLFRAAVAVSGFCNLTSLYGLFDARQRYDEFVHEDLFQATLAELGQLRMANPPYRDLVRYVRNSPLFAIEQVQTPLMIVQGDLDYVPIQQGEEFFQGLYRLGKRADFVRYWGEGHSLSSPANIRDLWQRIFSWFEQFS